MQPISALTSISERVATPPLPLVYEQITEEQEKKSKAGCGEHKG